MSIHVDETYDQPIPGDESFPHRQVTARKSERLSENYILGEEIGRGKFGVVHRCTDKRNGLCLAVKFVATPKSQDKIDVEREIEIMNSLQHPSIIQLYDAFDTNKEMALVVELVEGGELFDRVLEDDYILTEKACAVFIRQIFSGIQYIHWQNILHLDLKPENIICTSKSGNHIKIIDFGLACRFDPTKPLQVLFGTPEFVAPEVVNFDTIGLATDVWSIGVITYVLVSGLSPFMGDNDYETMANVTIAQYDFDDEAFDDVSDACKDFISKILIKEKSKRLTSDQALKHQWLTQVQPRRTSKLPVRAETEPSNCSKPTIQLSKDKQFDRVERWLMNPENPDNLEPNSSSESCSTVNSAYSVNSIGNCSPSACPEVSSFSSEHSDSSTDSAVVPTALLRPEADAQRTKRPLDRVRAASLRREESLKKIRTRLAKQASKEETYISLEEMKKLKQSGVLSDALLKVSNNNLKSRRSSENPCMVSGIKRFEFQDALSSSLPNRDSIFEPRLTQSIYTKNSFIKVSVTDESEKYLPVVPQSIRQSSSKSLLSQLIDREVSKTIIQSADILEHSNECPESIASVTLDFPKPVVASLNNSDATPPSVDFSSSSNRASGIPEALVTNKTTRDSRDSIESKPVDNLSTIKLQPHVEPTESTSTNKINKTNEVSNPTQVTNVSLKPVKPVERHRLYSIKTADSAEGIIDFRNVKLKPVRLSEPSKLRNTGGAFNQICNVLRRPVSLLSAGSSSSSSNPVSTSSRSSGSVKKESKSTGTGSVRPKNVLAPRPAELLERQLPDTGRETLTGRRVHIGRGTPIGLRASMHFYCERSGVRIQQKCVLFSISIQFSNVFL